MLTAATTGPFMRRAVLAAAFLVPMSGVPAYSAGGAGGQQTEDCPKGKVRDKQTKKCVDAQRGTDISYDTQYEPGVIPTGFHAFCEANPVECAKAEPDILTSEWFPTLERINRQVNASIRFKAEDDMNADKWTLSPLEGDCDDYTVTKRQMLNEAGVPRGAMRAAFVRTIDETNHVFLIVSTTGGDFVLDNGTDEVYELERAMITRLSVQDASNPRIWWQIY